MLLMKSLLGTSSSGQITGSKTKMKQAKKLRNAAEKLTLELQKRHAAAEKDKYNAMELSEGCEVVARNLRKLDRKIYGIEREIRSFPKYAKTPEQSRHQVVLWSKHLDLKKQRKAYQEDWSELVDTMIGLKKKARNASLDANELHIEVHLWLRHAQNLEDDALSEALSEEEESLANDLEALWNAVFHLENDSLDVVRTVI